jgi:cobalt-zinc-cadmium efflux system outer membrane protein
MSGSREITTSYRIRRHPLKAKRVIMHLRKTIVRAAGAIVCAVFAVSAHGQAPQGPVRITLDQAIQLALQNNHSLLANRTNIPQNLANEVTANLRPNPTLFTDWEYLPLYKPGVGILDYLHDSTEGDIGLSYLFERGKKRQHRLQAAKGATAVTRSLVVDNERTLTFQVAQLFVNVQLAESTLDLALQDVKSFQETVNIAEAQYRVGAMSENDFLKIKLQLFQFQQDVEQAGLARVQALADLRQQLGSESVPAEYDVTGAFEYQPATVKLDDLQTRAVLSRPDLRAAQLGITAANSNYELAKANGKQDVTVSGNYSHVNGLSAVTFSMSVPLPIFDRNQGNIAQTHYAITQAQQQQLQARGQVMDDVKDAYEGLIESDRITQYFRNGYLEAAQKSRDISEYSFRRGATSLLDFLDAERTYRVTQLAYRQAVAACLTALEQLREAVGTRSLP